MALLEPRSHCRAFSPPLQVVVIDDQTDSHTGFIAALENDVANLDARIVTNKQGITALQGSAITQPQAEDIVNTAVATLSKAVSSELGTAIDAIKAKVRNNVAEDRNTRQAPMLTL